MIGGNTAGRNRLSGALVIAEVSLAVALLEVAGLTMRSLTTNDWHDSGIRSQEILSVELNLPESRYPDADQRTAFFRELLDRVRTLPGVESAATTYVVPVGPGGWQNV
jgi:hypothetical protein